MKRFSKFLALTLLLAVVVSAFGVFSVAAETSTSETSNEAITYWSLDSRFDTASKGKGYYTVNKGSTDDGSGISYPIVLEKTDASGNNYYSFGFEGWDPSVAYPTGSGYDQLSPTSRINFHDYTLNDVSYEKNAEYMIIDFDYNIENAPLSDFTLNLYFYDATGARMIFENVSLDDQTIEMNSITVDRADRSETLGDITADAHTSDGWIDVTYIFDASGRDVGIDTYIYINGIYVGEGSHDYVTSGGGVQANRDDKVTYFSSFRMTATAGNGTNSSIALDNLTIKVLPEDYNGILSEEGTIANEYITLDSIPELSYCLDNHADPLVVAEVARGEETIYYNSVFDLDGALESGDVVTLKRPVRSTILIPTGANITWQGDYAAPATLEVDFTANDWVVRNLDGSLFADGAMGVQDDDTGTYADNLATYLSGVTSGAADTYTNIMVTFLKDATLGASTVNGNLIYDLNGNTVSSNGANALTSNDKFTVMNGSLEVIISGISFVTARYDAASYCVSFYNMDSIKHLTGRANFDYFVSVRGSSSRILFDNCENVQISVNALVSAGSRRSTPSSVILLDSNFTLNSVASLAKFSHAKTIGANAVRFGDTKAYLAAKNITATTAETTSSYKDEMIWFEAAANEHSGSYAYTEENIARVNIENSEFNVSTHGLLGFNLATAVDGLNFDCDVTLNNVTATTPGVITTDAGADITATDYAYTVDANVKDCSFNYTDNSGFINRTATNSTVNCNFSEGTKFSSYALVGEGESTDGITEVLPEGCKVAHTALYEGYTEIVTSNYTDNNYAMADGETSGQFYWNDEAGDDIDITRFATLTAAGATYKYEWEKAETAVGYDFTETLAPNFKPSVSLSTNGYLALNIFVPDGVAIKDGAYAVENGVTLGQYGDTATYNMAKIEAIDPTDANVDYAVDVIITGAYGDTLEKAVNVSVIKYADSVLANYTDENSAENKYAVALLGYIKSVMEYADADYTDALAAIDTALAGKTAAAATKPNAVDNENMGSANGVTSYAMNLGGSINWVIDATAGATYTVKVGNGNAVERTADETGKLYISVRAYEVYETVSVSDGENTLTFNISNYYNEPTTTSEAKVVVDALAAYAEAAVAYKAQLDAAN